MRLAAVDRAPRAGATPPLWPPLLATRGPGARSDGHAHHAMHLVLAVDGELAFRVGARGRWQRAAGILTAPDVAHALDADGREVLLVFLDPDSDAGAALRAHLTVPVRAVTADERAGLLHDADPRAIMGAGGVAWTARVVEQLGGGPAAPRQVHPRVRALLRHLRALPPDGDVSLPALATAVGLSPGRLMHAFTASIGVPLRAYLLWLRLQRAAAGIVGGLALSAAAHAAGFADAAHMSRTFRRMLGLPPSALRRR